MAKTYSAGGVAHGAKYWRLTIDVRESDGERRRLTKTTKIACAKNGTRGRSAALTALRQWRGEPIRQAEAEDSVGSGTPTADYAEDFIARHSEMAPATREKYMRAVRDMRLARIGEVPISMFKPSDVQDWMIWLRARLPEPLALAGIIALMTGMRRGEIRALRWQNWDEDRQMLLVRHALAKGENGR